MNRPFELGSVAWLTAMREGAFSNLKPAPWEKSFAPPSAWAELPDKLPEIEAIEPEAFTYQEINKRIRNGWPVEIPKYFGKPCAYCGTHMVGAYHPTKDHIFPRSRGGTLDPKNVLVACRPCNGEKSNQSLREFVWYLAEKSDPRAGRALWIIKRLPEHRHRF